ncbi:MAG: hypothetical protein IPM53_32075 [Anaerolineaceae bacterium]|nr:hypothetical protein [Anaerolineaceae bacterium]
MRKSLTVFFFDPEHRQDEDSPIILASGQHGAVALAPFLVGHFVNADAAQVLDLLPVDFFLNLTLQGTHNGIVAQVLFQADISHRAADEQFHQVPVIGFGVRAALVIPFQCLCRGRMV